MKIGIVYTCTLAAHPPTLYNKGTGAQGVGLVHRCTVLVHRPPPPACKGFTMFTFVTLAGAPTDLFTAAPCTPAPQLAPALPPVLVHPTHRAHGVGNPTGQVVYTVCGVALCSVLRWLGANGATPSQARAVCTGAGINPSKHTITTQLQHGRHGRHSVPVLAPHVVSQVCSWAGIAVPAGQ